jgi:hypothetical protein
MGVLRRIAITVGIMIESFIVLFLAIAIIALIVTLNEEAEAAYNSSYQEAYETGYQEGYNKGYQEGHDEGFENAFAIGYKEGLLTRVNLRNPTYKELMEFLARDKTDLKPYIKDEYICSDFSADVNINAELEGIRAAWVVVKFPPSGLYWGHALVAFETIDKGLIFIEPQLDEIAKPVIGKSYWQSVGRPRPLYYDDTVVEIQIIW